jgi:class 3 adenylate cyclase
MDETPGTKADETLGSLEHWRNASREAEASGDYLGAVDAALVGLDQHDRDCELQYRAVLNLSRTGALKSARELWQRYRFETAIAGGHLPSHLDEAVRALGARLDREDALAADSPDRPARLRSAAARYEAIYRRSGRTFPGINAAVLYQLADESDRARALAAGLLARCGENKPADAAAAYQAAADRAAACLLLDRLRESEAALAEAASLAPKAASIASTRRQLAQICAHKKIDPSILEQLRNRAVVHYTGHMISPPGKPGRFPAQEEQQIAAAIGDALERRHVGHGYGSLASGTDILVAEHLLARGGEVNVVLPFDRAAFRDESVAPAGPSWVERFEACMRRVGSSQATDGGYTGDAAIFAFASHLAMGVAMLRAQHLAADLFQIAVWDGRETDQPAGTWADLREWRRLGRETLIIGTHGTAPGPGGTCARLGPTRHVRAIMFGDFKGFSGLDDFQILTFCTHVMGCVANVLARHEAHVATRNTWGDGLYVVFDDLGAAARCALELQSALAGLDLAGLGLPLNLGLRLALHAAAVFEIEDPVLRSRAYAGSHISRTARLEPVTPPGQVFVTEEFAALMMLQPHGEVICDYVGLMPAAKGYGRLRMYLLRRVGQDASGRHGQSA